MPNKPAENLYPEYYSKYTRIVPEGDIFDLLNSNKVSLVKFLSDLSDEQAEYKYEEGKWSIKEVLGHIIDTERIFTYRALRMARNDKTNIPQYDHDAYVAEAEFDSQSISDLIEQYKAVREATLSLFKSFSNESWERIGFSGEKEFVVKSFPYILVGHEMHHLSVIKERYLPGITNSEQ